MTPGVASELVYILVQKISSMLMDSYVAYFITCVAT